MLEVTFFGTTSLLFDDGKNQILFDAHFTRPSLIKYIAGAKVKTNTKLCDKLISLHHIDRLKASMASAFPMQDVIPVIMERLIYELYREKGIPSGLSKRHIMNGKESVCRGYNRWRMVYEGLQAE